jgi:hypothetical protein
MDRRDAGIALGTGLVATLLVFVVEAMLLSTQLSVAVPVALVVGLLVGAVVYPQTG